MARLLRGQAVMTCLESLTWEAVLNEFGRSSRSDRIAQGSDRSMQACASYMSSIQLAVLGGAVAHGPLDARVSSDDMSRKTNMGGCIE